MSIFTRTPLHVGCGSSVGAVDQPVVRERHTGYPVIPGSTIKGVLADLWLDWSDPKNPKRDTEGVDLLGAESGAASAGTLLIGEGKLLAFPVRSAKGCFAWKKPSRKDIPPGWSISDRGLRCMRGCRSFRSKCKKAGLVSTISIATTRLTKPWRLCFLRATLAHSSMWGATPDDGHNVVWLTTKPWK